MILLLTIAGLIVGSYGNRMVEDLSKHFCTNMELIDHGNKEVHNSRVCFDRARRLGLMMRNIKGKGPTKEILDFNTGIIHSLHENTGRCDYSYRNPVGQSMVVELNDKHMIDADLLFNINNKYEQQSDAVVRDGKVPSDVYKLTSTALQGFTVTWYLSKNDWTFSKTHFENSTYQQPLKLVTAAPDGTWSIETNYWNHDGNRPALSNFDLAKCYQSDDANNDNKTDFQIIFLADNATTDASFEELLYIDDVTDAVVEAIHNATGIPLLRFSQTTSRVEASDRKIYLTSTLLPSPPSTRLRLISRNEAWRKISNAVFAGNLKVILNEMTLTASDLRKDILRSDVRGHLVNDVYMGKFGKDVSQMVFVDPLKVIKGIPIQECAKRCIMNLEFNCESFNYCPSVGDCLLSNLHSPVSEKTGSFKNHSFCDHYTRAYSKSHFSNIPGKVIQLKNDKIIHQHSVDSCAKVCLDETDFKCQSFDFCISSGICMLSRLHMTDEEATVLPINNTCAHWSRSLLGQFKPYQDKSIRSGVTLSIGGVSKEACAKTCLEETEFVCKSFDYCMDETKVSVCNFRMYSPVDLVSSDLADNPECIIYERKSAPQSGTLPKFYNPGTVAGLSIGMMVLGLLLGIVIMYAVQRYRSKNTGGWGLQMFKNEETK
ncbi:unnamed protein product [Owenia fusiformis]|nr:unnamed protein product [Owenia fusiformis]